MKGQMLIFEQAVRSASRMPLEPGGCYEASVPRSRSPQGLAVRGAQSSVAPLTFASQTELSPEGAIVGLMSTFCCTQPAEIAPP